MAIDDNAAERTAATCGAEGHHVRVGYQSTDYGLALAIDRTCHDRPRVTGERCCDHGGRDRSRLLEATDGLLRAGEAVVTLEVEMSDGRPTVLAWDPAEVNWSALAA